MKLFNLKFLKENVKKSNGVLLFLIFIIPVFNIVTLFAFLKQNKYVVGFTQLNAVNFIGALVLPIIFSYSLNKYLFKQNSVDFYLSKPISRCKLYFTNILGGFLLILCLTLLNSIIFLIFGLFTNMLLPFNFIIDYFIYFLILYFFVFIVSTLSISLAGNFVTSFIITLIIMGMPLAITFTDKILYDNYNEAYLNVSKCNNASSSCSSSNESNYKVTSFKNISSSLSLPTSYIVKSEFNLVDVIKTFILCDVYTILGYIAFKKRKMENNNIGFLNEFIHYTVKTITIIPFTLITTIFIYEKNLLTGFLIIIIAFIFSIIYDIFTRKNNYDAIKSLVVFIWTFVLLCFCDFGLIKLYSRTVILDIKNLAYKNLYVDSIVYKTKTLDFIENINKSNDTISEQFYLANTNKQIFLNITNNDYNELHKNDYEDYRKYANEYNYNLVNGAYLNLEKLNISNFNFKNIKTTKNKNDMIIDLYAYRNHSFEYLRIPIDANKDILKNLSSHLNKKFIQNKNNTIDKIFMPYNDLDWTQNLQILRYILNKYPDVLKNYLIKHYDDEVKDSYIVIAYKFKNTVDKIDNYIINDVSSFQEFINSYKDLCYNDGNCQKE